MTTVGRVASPQTPPRAAGAKAASSAFRLPDATQSEAASSAAAVSGALGLLAVQMMGDAFEQDRRAKRDADLALGDLREVQLALIDGRPSHIAPLLGRLEALLQARPQDPVLKEAIEELRVRIAVEAARQQRRAATVNAPGQP